MAAKKNRQAKDPVTEVVGLIDRVVTQAQLTQFQIKTINMRLDALEKASATPSPRRKAVRR